MLTLATTPEQELALRIEAERTGQSVEQLALRFLSERLPSPQQREDDDVTAALDELYGCLADTPSVVSDWRRHKEEEMLLEEEQFLRRFRGHVRK